MITSKSMQLKFGLHMLQANAGRSLEFVQIKNTGCLSIEEFLNIYETHVY